MSQYKTQRDLSFLYQNIDDPQITKDNQIATEKIEQFVKNWKENTEYLEDPTVLKKALDEYEPLMADYLYGTREGAYFAIQKMLSQDEDVRAKATKAELFSRELFIQLDFFELSLGTIDPATQKTMLKDQSLSIYKHFLEKIFNTSKYQLSEEQEAIVTKLSKGAYANRTEMNSDFFSKEEEQINGENKTLEQLFSLTASTDKKTRDQAGQAIHDITERNADVSEKELNSVLEYRYTMDQIRGYKRADESRHIGDDVDSDTVDKLIAVVEKNYDIVHRYYKLKAQILGQDNIEYHERQVPITLGTEPSYSFDDGVDMVKNAFSNLHPYFTKVFESFLEKGKIDVHPQKGKIGGAYNIPLGKKVGNIVMLNRTARLNDVTTLAHEMGHALHTHTIYKKQNGLNSSYGMCVAEVASTFMEDFVYEEILKDADEKIKLQILVERLNDYVSAVARQIACYTTEQELHTQRRAKGHLSKESIGEIFLKHMSNYMGPSVIMSDGAENRRTYWDHIRCFFYVYSYASGYLIAKSLQTKVKNDPKFVEQYIDIFLSAGSSETPKQTFEKLGIDISDASFWQSGIDEVRSLMDEAESLAKKLNLL